MTRHPSRAWRAGGRVVLGCGLLAAAMSLAVGGDEPRVAGRDGVTNPQRLHEPLPRYPLGAERRGIAGVVALRFVVGVDGAVSQLAVLSSSNPGHGFEESAVDAVKRWRFAPALHDGKPVPACLDLRVEFSPEEDLRRRRRQQVEDGLRAYARSELLPPDALVTGENGVSVPSARKQPSPVFPAAARRRRIESWVILLLRIDAAGDVAEIPLAHAESKEYPFEYAAVSAVIRWRFTPPLLDERPVEAFHWLRLDFRDGRVDY